MEENYKLEREYKVAPEMFDKAYRAYQKKFIFPKCYIFMALFLILAADFTYAAVKTPDNYLAYILIVVCIALAFREWHNPNFLRRRLFETIKELGEPVYKIGIGDDFIDISTVDEGLSDDEEDYGEEAENAPSDNADDDTDENNNEDDEEDQPDEDDLPPEIDPYPEKTRINLKEGYKLLEYDEFFLLMQGKQMFYILPKEGFSEAELEIVRKTNTANT